MKNGSLPDLSLFLQPIETMKKILISNKDEGRITGRPDIHSSDQFEPAGWLNLLFVGFQCRDDIRTDKRAARRWLGTMERETFGIWVIHR